MLSFQALGTEKGSTIFIKCFPYYIAANCEAFILCYTGEYLMFKVKYILKYIPKLNILTNSLIAIIFNYNL